MGAIASAFEAAFRDYVTTGVPASGEHEPEKDEIRAIGPLVETAVATAGLGGLVDVIHTTRAAIDADLAHPADTVGLVYADATDGYNDLYIKTGAPGAGGWTNTGALHGIIASLAGPYVAQVLEGLAVISKTVDERNGTPGAPVNGVGNADANRTWRLDRPFSFDGDVMIGVYVSANVAVTALAIADDGSVADATALNLVAGLNEIDIATLGLEMPAGGQFALHVPTAVLRYTNTAQTPATVISSTAGLYAGGGGWVGTGGVTLQMYAINRTIEYPITAETFETLAGEVAGLAAGAPIARHVIGPVEPSGVGGGGVDANSTFIHNRMLPPGAKYYLHSLRRPEGGGAGNVGLSIFSRDEEKGWKTRSEVVSFGVDQSELVSGGGLPFIPLFERQVPALYNGVASPIALRAIAGQSDGGWFAIGGDPTEVDMSAPLAGFALQWAFDIREVAGNSRRLYGQYLPQITAMMHVIAYDQSNTSGADSVPLLSVVPNFHWTFGVGPKMTKAGIVGPGGAPGTNPDDGTVKHLAEDAGAPIGAPGNYGETPLSSMVKAAARRGLQRGTLFQYYFASYAGFPGTTLANLAKGQPWYENFPYHVDQAGSEMEALGIRHSVLAIITGQGESDQANNTSTAAYYATARQLISDMQADAMASVNTRSGQDWLPHVLVITPTYHIKTSRGATEAWNRLARERDDVHMVAPGYRFPYANGTHFSNVGQMLRGEYWGRALDQILDGRKPDSAEWLGFTRRGSTVFVTLRAPTPMAFDGEGADFQAVNKGIVVVDAGNAALPITGMAWSVVGYDRGTGWPISQLAITVTGTPTAFRYALDAQGPSMGAPGLQITQGASGNICDTTPDTVTIQGTEYSMAHWAQPVAATLITVE
jgi:hypothetical protein